MSKIVVVAGAVQWSVLISFTNFYNVVVVVAAVVVMD